MLPPDISDFRNYMVGRFIKGSGIEIGAGSNPVKLPDSVKVKYVDYLSYDELTFTYPNLPKSFVPPDIVDDGSKLDKFRDLSLDFIIANHVLEHVEDPIRTLKTWLRKLRKDGTIFLAIPHKDFCFDRDRPTTELDHFERDHKLGPAWSRDQHYAEFAELSQKTPAGSLRSQIESLKKRDYRIHFHTWTNVSFIKFLILFADKYEFCSIEQVARNHTELIAVLRKVQVEEQTIKK